MNKPTALGSNQPEERRPYGYLPCFDTEHPAAACSGEWDITMPRQPVRGRV